MKKTVLLFATLMTSVNSQADVGDLLITEIAVTPFGSEFVEIHNKGLTTVDLSDVYLTDATFANGSVYYYQIVNGAGGGGGFFDFHARFPDGATIEAGAYQTISINGSTEFFNAFGLNPTYELFEDGAADGIPDMREAFPTSISGQGGLTDGGEVVVLYTWDGSSDLVQDLDYVVWGDKVEAIDKTGVSIDGPDGDSTNSIYLADTDIASQVAISSGAHASGNSWQRSDLDEGTEVQSGGNGVNGSDEMSENTDTTFTEATPTPNAETGGTPPPSAPNVLINEVDAVGSVEFVELYGDANESLDDVKVVFYDGATDQVYNVLDLTGESTDGSGYYLIGDSSLTPDMTLPASSIEDGADAVAIYFTTDTINNGDPLSTTDLIDAIVYDTDDADDAGLLALLNGGQPQVNENSNGNASTESSARCGNGTGGAFNTVTYQQVSPTPGMVNNACSSDYYAAVTPQVEANPALLRSTLHQIIDDHTSFSYSQACDIIEFADADPDNSSQVWMLYSNISYNDIDSCAGSYNREHTWPNSRFTGDTGSTVGSDTHHLMATNVDYNQRRGNRYFDNCEGPCSNFELTTVANNGVGGGSDHGDSNWVHGIEDIFEVWDFRKGDVARAMFYMDVRYEGDSGEPDLQLTDNTALLDAGTVNYMGVLTTLCEWHFADPVDVHDQTRNEAVFSFQQNRNPFVDHPEWVAMLYAECAAVDPGDNDLIYANGFD